MQPHQVQRFNPNGSAMLRAASTRKPSFDLDAHDRAAMRKNEEDQALAARLSGQSRKDWSDADADAYLQLWPSLKDQVDAALSAKFPEEAKPDEVVIYDRSGELTSGQSGTTEPADSTTAASAPGPTAPEALKAEAHHVPVWAVQMIRDNPEVTGLTAIANTDAPKSVLLPAMKKAIADFKANPAPPK